MSFIRQLIESRMESTEPQNTILEVLRAHNGKRFDKRMEKKLREATGDENLRIIHEYGMTSIITGDYYRTDDKGNSKGIRIYVFNHTSAAPIDVDDIFNRNTALFSALVKRNEQRKEILKTDYPEMIEALAKNLNKVRDEFLKLMENAEDEIGLPDEYAIRDELFINWKPR